MIPVVPNGKDYKSADKGEVTQHIINLFEHIPNTPAVTIDDLPDNIRKFRKGLGVVGP